MSPAMVGAIGLALLLFVMFLGLPLAVSMASVGVAGYLILRGSERTLAMVSMVPYTTLASYTMSVLPIFILMGEFADISGLMRDSYRAANTWLGGLRGGLAMASITGAAIFSAVSGSSMACAALMTRVSLPSLLEYKYDPKLATGALCAGGTLGNLIPPGIAFVFYAIMSETSIGKLYIAAILPGILLTSMYMVQIYFQCRLNPSLGPPGPSTGWKEKLLSFKYVWATLLLFGLVMGGIWFGIYTATEAGAIGTVGAFLFALVRRTLNGQKLLMALRNSARVAGMGFAVVIGAQIFTAFVTVTGLSRALADWVVGLNLSPLGVVIAIMIIYTILGTAMDTLSMILLTVPIFIGVLSALDIDLYWFGVLLIVQIELANLSPPVGMNLFVVASLVKEKGISMGTIFRGVLPFCLTMVVFNAILVVFPQISLFLPNSMK